MDEKQGTKPSSTEGASSGLSPDELKKKHEQERKDKETGDINQAAKETKRDSN
jgi:hypothetical protein